MEATTKPPRPSRLRLFLQPTIIRIYKGLGIAALGGILLALIVFLTINVFYFFNDSWVRPQILSPNHKEVIAAVSAEADAKLARSALEGQREEARDELAQLDRVIATATTFEADVAPLMEGPIKDASAAMLRRQVDQSVLDRAAAADRKEALQRRLQDLEIRMAEQDAIIERLRKSPYLRAANGRVVVGFVPYENLERVRPGVALYGCQWGLVRCSRVGKVISVLDGEVQDFHPHDNEPERGVLVEIELTNKDAAEWDVLFADRKPFWVF